MLSNVEANAKVVIDELLEHRDPAQVDPERMALFAWHLALTYTRGRAFPEQANSMTADVVRMQWGQITDDGIREELGRLGIEVTQEVFASHRAFFDDLASGEVRAEQSDAALIARSAELAYPIGAEWFKREWVIFRTRPTLVSCDEPVNTVGGPGWPRDERAGVGSADVVMYPLSPSDLLVLFHAGMRPRGPASLDRGETIEVNREVIGNASRWAFERPSRHVTELLTVPPAPAEAHVREDLPVAEGETGEIFRTYSPSRWPHDVEAPPWPVSRWWDGWSHAQYPRVRDLAPGETVTVREPLREPKRRSRNPRKARRRR